MRAAEQTRQMAAVGAGRSFYRVAEALLAGCGEGFPERPSSLTHRGGGIP